MSKLTRKRKKIHFPILKLCVFFSFIKRCLLQILTKNRNIYPCTNIFFPLQFSWKWWTYLYIENKFIKNIFRNFPVAIQILLLKRTRVNQTSSKTKTHSRTFTWVLESWKSILSVPTLIYFRILKDNRIVTWNWCRKINITK
jgi:hypothetical protein